VPAVLAILFGLATVAVMLFAYGYIGIWSYAIALLLVTFFFIPIYQRLVFDKKGFDQSTIAGSVIAILLVVFTAFLVTVNMASAYSYSMNIGPSICFPKYNSDNLLDVEPCVTVDASGNDVMSSGQPWYEAMTFLADDTPENSSVLSWWDFGYWFQTRGDRPTVADGGHSGGAYRETDQEIADWYVDDYNNWGNYTDWLKERKVGYILMDYTLPGKYGAISKIASDGSTVVGMLQFTQKGVEPNGNDTVYVFANGQYEIWLPMNSQGSLSGTPMFLVSQNGQYVQRAYINDVCTTQGIVTIGSEDQFIPGCVAISDLGIFYIPPEAEHTIFTDLMFMNGVNSPVEKVFDNQLIKIYKLDI
jgi:hypothetical protein